MPSIADYKKQILLKRNLKNDPLGTLVDKDKSFSGYFFEAMKDMVSKITETAIKDLLSNKEMFNKIASASAELAMSAIRVPKDGDNGDKGDDGYTPIKGKDYFTDKEIEKMIKKATPLKGKDYFTDKEIEKFKRELKPIAGIDYPMPENGKDGNDGNQIEGEAIIDKINSLPLDDNKKIDAKHIKGLAEGTKESVPLFRGGLKLIWNTELSGTVNGVNTVFTIPAGLPDPKDDKFIVSARGVLKTSDAGDFTASNNNRTITFTSAPPSGSDAPRIILYHGK